MSALFLGQGPKMDEVREQLASARWCVSGLHVFRMPATGRALVAQLEFRETQAVRRCGTCLCIQDLPNVSQS